MVWISYSKEQEEKSKKFLAMSADEFDKYMCEKYPVMFKERKLPMSQTCMCWGFCIGPGWYRILDELCERLEFIYGISGQRVVFGQIKEKFGGARFYFGIETEVNPNVNPFTDNKHWREIIHNEISRSEELCDYFCASCGEQKHETITLGGWVYDDCEKCLEKNKRTAGGLKIWREIKELKRKSEDLAYRGNKEETKQLKKLIKSFEIRVKKEQAKQEKEYKKSQKAYEKQQAKLKKSAESKK